MVINHVELMDGRAAMVEIEGPLDSRSAPEFEEYIRRLLERSILFIIFNAGKMEYASSEGIGLLLYLQSRIAEGNGFFVLFGLSPEIAALFSRLGFDRVFRIANDRAEAVEIMDRQMEMRDRPEPAEPVAPVAIPVAAEETPVRVEEPVPNEAEPSRPSGGPEAGPPPATALPSVPPAKTGASRLAACESCGAELRIRGAGSYLCPHCDAFFTVPGTPAETPPAVPSASFSPLIVECAACKALVRVKQSGAYQCPECGKGFSVDESQSVSF